MQLLNLKRCERIVYIHYVQLQGRNYRAVHTESQHQPMTLDPEAQIGMEANLASLAGLPLSAYMYFQEGNPEFQVEDAVNPSWDDLSKIVDDRSALND